MNKIRLARTALHLLFLFPLAAFAEGRISRLSGTVRHGETLTISGSGFGAKSPASPLAFDDVEKGRFSPAWRSSDNLEVTERNPRHPRSRFSGLTSFSDSSLEGRFRTPNKPSRSWFIHYWFHLYPNWTWGTTNEKGSHRALSKLTLARFWNPHDLNENLEINLLSWKNAGEVSLKTSGGLKTFPFLEKFKDLLKKNQWHQFQMEVLESDPPGTENGAVKIWINGKPVFSETQLITREDPVDFKHPLVVGFSSAWGPNEKKGETTKGLNQFQIDEAYADGSLARVEIGDHVEYERCTVREIQDITSWSDNAVSIRVNQGGFQKGQIGFLFVTDAKGVRAGPGMPFYFDGPYTLAKKEGEVQLDENSLKKTAGQYALPDYLFELTLYREDGKSFFVFRREGEKSFSAHGENGGPQNPPSGTFLGKLLTLHGSAAFQKVAIEDK